MFQRGIGSYYNNNSNNRDTNTNLVNIFMHHDNPKK